jgi:hypothetical protein
VVQAIGLRNVVQQGDLVERYAEGVLSQISYKTRLQSCVCFSGFFTIVPGAFKGVLSIQFSCTE